MEQSETTETTATPVNGLDTPKKAKKVKAAAKKSAPVEEPKNEVAPLETTEIGQYFLPFLTPTSADPPASMSFEQWDISMAALKIAEEGLSWWVGDMMDFAQTKGKDFEDRAIQRLHELGYADKTVKNVLKVCQFLAKSRRRDDISFSHHETVYAMKNKKRADELLALAATQKWTVPMLRDAVREAEARKVGSKAEAAQPKAPEPSAVAAEVKSRAAKINAQLREPDAVAAAGVPFPVAEEDFAALLPLARSTQTAMNEAIAYLEQPARENIGILNEKLSIVRDRAVEIMDMLEEWGAEAL